MSSSKPGLEQLLAQAARIKLIVLDVDGTLTDGGLYYGPTGETLKRFHVRDGQGLALAILARIEIAWITGRTSEANVARARELKIRHLFQGESDKVHALKTLLTQTGIDALQCAYMGDDLPDLPCLSLVGLAACPADAVHEIRQASHFVAQNCGGHGAVRELVELCLKASGNWDALGYAGNLGKVSPH